MNPLDQLRTILPQPKRPYCANGDWSMIESSLVLSLPADYKEFIATYGAGSINALEVQSPFVWVATKRDVRRAWIDLASIYEDFARYGEEIPYDIYPLTGGLLPFATWGDVNLLNWLTIRSPDQWPLVYYGRTTGFTELEGFSTVEFVLESVTERSSLFGLLGAKPAEPPCYFLPYSAEPRSVRLVHPQAVDMEALVARWLLRWPEDEVRIRRTPSAIRLLVESLQGSLAVSRDGDPKTWVQLKYDQAQSEQAEAVVKELLALGFSVLDRT